MYHRASIRDDFEAFITRDEARWAWNNVMTFHGIKPSPESMDLLFDRFDTDANNEINLSEFAEAYNLWMTGQFGKIMMYFFDIHGDDKLEMHEWQKGYDQVVAMMVEDPCNPGETMQWPTAADAFDEFQVGDIVENTWTVEDIDNMFKWFMDCPTRYPGSTYTPPTN